AAFACQAGEGQAALAVRPLDQRVADLLDFGSNGFEEARAEVAARDAEGVKSLRGGSDGRVDFSGRRFGEPGLEALLRRGINSVKRRCGVGARDPGDEVASVKRHQ